MQKKLWFTFVELIVATTILIILTTLGFYSYSQYMLDARDTQRKSDLTSISSSLKLYKQRRGSLPLPWSNYSITYNGVPVATQGKLDNTVTLSTLDKLPLDPLIKSPYIFSITPTKQEYQIWATLENNGNNIAYIEGIYKTVSRDNLPTLLLALASTTPIEITSWSNKDKFIFNNQGNNLPYDLESWVPYANGTTFTTLIATFSGTTDLWQNSDYRSCLEIYQSGKSIGTGTYQIVNASGVLANINCNVDASWALY